MRAVILDRRRFTEKIIKDFLKEKEASFVGFDLTFTELEMNIDFKISKFDIVNRNLEENFIEELADNFEREFA